MTIWFTLAALAVSIYWLASRAYDGERPDVFEVIIRSLAMIVTLTAALTVVYVAVRFVKWAWTD